MNKLSEMMIDAFENDCADDLALDLRLDLSDMMHAEMHTKKLSQTELAKLVGIRVQVLKRILHGSSNCTFESAAKILFALGVKAKLVDTARYGKTQRVAVKNMQSVTVRQQFGTNSIPLGTQSYAANTAQF